MIRTAVVLGHLGRVIVIVGVAMVSCLIWSLEGGEAAAGALAVSALVTVGSGLALVYGFPVREGINFREGFVLVSLGWVLASLFGTLPFVLSGYLPSFADAWFETVSGFTTTGASVVADVESWPKGLMFWRCLTQWLGGMGIIALFVAIIAGIGVRANQLFKAEVPGPVSEKISPRIRETARRLWLVYVALSAVCAALLYLLGMDAFDALCHTFTTMATGGFSTKNASIGFYRDPLIQWTITLFMFLAGANFALHFLALKQKSLGAYWRNAEFRLYAGITAVGALLVAWDLHCSGAVPGLEPLLRAALFQVVSVATTTGFATADFSQWPTLAAGALILLMLSGGCAGSTGGNIKPGRYLIIGTRTVIELRKMIHPRAVIPLRFGTRVVSDDLLINVLQFFFLYILFLALGTLAMSGLGLDPVSSFTAAAACLGNIGPGLGLVGPAQNYAFLPPLGKYLLSLLMLVGRLEIYPLLVLFLPEFWKE